MKAVVFREVGKGISVEEMPAPAVSGEHDVLIRVRDCGICGSDLAILEGRHPSKPPVILGHELSGEVVAVGKSVMSVAPEDHVVVDPNVSCGRCTPCRLGRRNMCLDMVELGITRNGGFAELMLAPENFVYRVRDRLSWRAAALIEPLACVVHGFERSRVQPDETAVVYGAGPMGLLWVTMLRRAGVDNVFSVDLSEKRREMAKQLGADVTIDPTENDPVELVHRLTDGRGADVAVEMIGRAETVENSVRSVGAGGRVVIMGVSRKDALSRISPFDVMAKEVEIIGSNANAYGFVPSIRLIESGAIPVDFLVSHEVPISEAQRAFDLCKSGEGLKVLIRPV
ncbi:MAG: zinc-dependent alcohol dehydrogenase family protein [Nitrososphaerota archaeon]|jgi:2-desacetyl-2-hydroxyethyl bacteriochlorophyllide A dehydrogenase|nr:zinc-dependent alcohol dehydrogenase family protein [Nitrososphaerota archaeon]